EVRAGRRVVAISRPGKSLIGDVTKLDLARYYEAVAPVMLPHLADRPLNLERYPDGIDGHRIIQQHAADYFPSWIRRARVRKRGGTVDHVVAGDPATLVYLANQAAITLHRWLSRRDRLERPDLMIVDLDPTVDDPDDVRRAAVELVGLVREIGLRPLVMTTGSRGYHVAVSLQRRGEHADVIAFARELAEVACAREPERLTTAARKANRGARIYVDVMRNAYAHTAVAPWSVRPRPGAPVAMPLDLSELEDRSMRPDRFTLRDAARRAERDGDPWAGATPQALGPARRALAALRA
ncbi:MAG TPA: DNA primase small subunit domain-containing protein, partial [Solirubrobacteraceae bacterium]